MRTGNIAGTTNANAPAVRSEMPSHEAQAGVYLPAVDQRRSVDVTRPPATGSTALHQKLMSALAQPAQVQEKAGRSLSLRQAEVSSLVQNALVTPMPGERQQAMEAAWSIVHRFDAQRLATGGNSDGLHLLPELDKVAADTAHPSHQDAVLLKDVLTRPLGNASPSLERYLADRVEKDLGLFMSIPPDPDFRTFNSVLPGLATSTLDYNSIGRTLLFKGATHLIGIPSAPADTDAQLSEEHADRKARLQTTIFHFPKQPEAGTGRLKLSDFDNMIDPLDDLGVYESSGPRFP